MSLAFNAAGSVTVFPDLAGPSNYIGQSLVNALGFIRRDGQFSFLDVQEVRSASDCACPIEQNHCLKLSCDLDSQGGNNCLTTPLVDAKTGLPFKITKGTLIDKIIIGKRKGVCLDPNACLLLGIIRDSVDDSAADHCAQRWIAESAPLTGDCLNACGFFKIDATAKCKACCLFNVDADCGASNTCGGDDYDCCPAPTPTACCDQTTLGACHPCGTSTPAASCLDPRSQLAAKFPGSVSIGECDDLYLGLTLINGCISADSLAVSVTVIEQASDCGFCGEFGPYPTFAAGQSPAVLFRH
jgi:hypothetical protein